jgi:hypothetical protein
LLLWVDKHDDAYAWARRRRCEINPETGALQIVDVQTVEETAAETPTVPVPKAPALFDEIRDRHLQRLGVPESLLPAVRRIASDEDLEALAPSLPEEAAEALFMVAAGYRLEEVLDEQEKSAALPAYAIEPGARDVDAKFDQALTSPDSRRRFWVVDDDGTLEAMLEAPLEKWRVFLHPSQRRLVERHSNGPVRVLGGAGTGKTVVAMHRAKWLAEHLADSAEEAPGRVLFVTFTRNLAADIEANLRRLCPLETMSRLRVAIIDGVVADHLKRHGYAHDIVFDDDPRVGEALTEKEDGLGLPDRFFRDEWREVAQAQGMAAEEDYLRAPRSGRGQALNRIRRARYGRCSPPTGRRLLRAASRRAWTRCATCAACWRMGRSRDCTGTSSLTRPRTWAPKRSGCCAAWQARSARTTCSWSATGTSGSTAGAPRLAPAASTSVAAAESCA